MQERIKIVNIEFTCGIMEMTSPKSPSSVLDIGKVDRTKSSSFDILSKWYIDGTLEHKQKTQERVKEDLLNEIKKLETEKGKLKLESVQYKRKIVSLEEKIDALLNEREEFKTTIRNLEKSLLGEHNFDIELNAQKAALDDFRDTIKYNRNKS